MSKEIVKVDSKQGLAVISGLMDATPIATNDLIIPKLLLMQPVSSLVADKKAAPGDIVNSLEGKVVGNEKEALEVIPYKCVKTWVRFQDMGRGKPRFVSQDPVTETDAVRPRQEEINGEIFTNFETINYYCLRPSEVEAGEFLPYVISFRSTSYKAGKTLETFRAKFQDYGKPICIKTFKIGSRQEENDQGRYYTFTVEQGRDTTVEEMAQIKPWFDRVTQGLVRVDESELAGDSDKAAPEASETSNRDY